MLIKISKLIAAVLMCTIQSEVTAQTVRDIDGNSYRTITIGNQIWMAENLKTTKFSDGKSIPLAISEKSWLHLIKPAYCWYDNNEAKYKERFGALYNWYTVNTKKLCPKGWHVPTDTDWDILINYLGASVAGGKLKETGSDHWFLPNEGASNETGFTALPGGSRNMDCLFDYMGRFGYWWSSSDSMTELINFASYKGMSYFVSSINGKVDYKSNGLSVRCIKD